MAKRQGKHTTGGKSATSERADGRLRVGQSGQLLEGAVVRWWRVERNLDVSAMLSLLDGADVVVRRSAAGAVEKLNAEDRKAARGWLPSAAWVPGVGVGSEVRYTADRYTDGRGKDLLFLEGHC